MLPAHEAARMGDIDAMRQMTPDELSTKDRHKEMPAHKAAAKNHLEVLQYLHKVVPDTLGAMDKNGITPALLIV